MTSEISDLLEGQGWHQSATLQRFKTFDFPAHRNVATLALRLLAINFSSNIHMQVTPKAFSCAVEVYLSYEPNCEEEVQELLLAIENVYIECMSDDS